MTDLKTRQEMTEEEKRERKLRILTHSAAAITRSITGAQVIKNGNMFFLTDVDGSVPPDEEHGFGLYHNDCRYLSGYTLDIGGKEPYVLVGNSDPGYEMIFELTNPSIGEDGEGAEIDQVAIRWERLLDLEACTLAEWLDLNNYSGSRARFPLSFTFRSDFRDVFAIRDLLPVRPGELEAPVWFDDAEGKADTLTFAYHGADGNKRRLDIRFSPPPDEVEETTARFRIDLEPGEQHQIQLRMEIRESREADGEIDHDRRPDTEFRSAAEARKQLPDRLEGQTEVATDSVLFNSILSRSLLDLRLLENRMDSWRYYAAGVPWFVTLFGRDSLLAAIQMLAFEPAMAEETLRLLASYQAHEVDDWNEAEPGKILHETRIGELANMHAIPYTYYYGSIDATPLFLILLSRHAGWTGSMDLFNEFRDGVEAALTWIDDYGDKDGDGYLEYDSWAMGERIANYGWKDSGNGILHPDGRLPEPPLALVEVQGYVYAAKHEIAQLYERAGDHEKADRLRGEAAELRERFNRDFWSEELGCYVLGLDGDKRQIAAVTTNPGHALWSGIAEPDKAQQTAERLMADDMYSGWGVRTMSSAHAAYNPTGYHLGTVWPHDNAFTAAGFHRYRLDAAAARIAHGIFDAASQFERQQLPECFAGYARSLYRVPVRYPVAAHPQAWSAGSIPYLLTTLLGLEPEGFDNRLRLARPVLPEYMNRLEIRGLKIGQGEVDLQFGRTAEGWCAAAVDRVTGNVDVVMDLVA
jgi:glycogen debranching enzyme